LVMASVELTMRTSGRAAMPLNKAWVLAMVNAAPVVIRDVSQQKVFKDRCPCESGRRDPLTSLTGSRATSTTRVLSPMTSFSCRMSFHGFLLYSARHITFDCDVEQQPRWHLGREQNADQPCGRRARPSERNRALNRRQQPLRGRMPARWPARPNAQLPVHTS
jgi:hypothetical protein